MSAVLYKSERNFNGYKKNFSNQNLKNIPLANIHLGLSLHIQVCAV